MRNYVLEVEGGKQYCHSLFQLKREGERGGREGEREREREGEREICDLQDYFNDSFPAHIFL